MRATNKHMSRPHTTAQYYLHIESLLNLSTSAEFSQSDIGNTFLWRGDTQKDNEPSNAIKFALAGYLIVLAYSTNRLIQINVSGDSLLTRLFYILTYKIVL